MFFPFEVEVEGDPKELSKCVHFLIMEYYSKTGNIVDTIRMLCRDLRCTVELYSEADYVTESGVPVDSILRRLVEEDSDIGGPKSIVRDMGGVVVTEFEGGDCAGVVMGYRHRLVLKGVDEWFGIFSAVRVGREKTLEDIVESVSELGEDAIVLIDLDNKDYTVASFSEVMERVGVRSEK